MARKPVKSVKADVDAQLLSMPPPPNQKHLPLHTVHDEDLESICVDIAEMEPGINRADSKRRRGVEQFGVDVEGFSEDQRPTLVISCKRYQRIVPSDLTNWGTDFLKHLDGHWKGKGVQKFVIAVTVELNDDALNDRIRTERETFKKHKLGYEVWGLGQLTSKLRRLTGTIARYFNADWVTVIGGATALAASAEIPSSSLSSANASATAAAQSLVGTGDAILERYGIAIARELEDALVRLKEGAVRPLRELVERIRSDRLTWDTLSPETKSKFLRSEGAIAIRDGNLIEARARYREADAYWPANDRASATLLVLNESGPETALPLLPDPTTSPESALRAAMLIELGRVDEALGRR